MVDFKKLAGRAKKMVDDRGGTDALKEDLQELKGIAKSEGSLTDKAKKAGEALKQPGSHEAPPRSPSPDAADTARTAHPEPPAKAHGDPRP